MRPVLVTSAILPVAAFAKIIKLLPVPAATLIESATFAYATFKLLTRVVEVTVSGAVPVAIFEVNVLATTAPAVLILPPPILPVAVIKPPVPMLPMLALPEIDNDVIVPKLVTLG